ncbi:MAG: DUF3576 domain-containing protein [Alphaproteobacteria bacterium]|nr:DUF3576 domain-containing protein [Alphaproteobacteria bacterium]
MKNTFHRCSAALFLAFLFALSACSSLGLNASNEYSNAEHDKLYRNGSVVSDEGGGFLMGGAKKDKDGLGIGVNGFLWRATLDTIAFMPIATADPFGGVITTDWYSTPADNNERVKLNVFILDRDLRADGVKVSVFRQTKGTEGTWVDGAAAPATASALEESILTRARQLRLAQKERG